MQEEMQIMARRARRTTLEKYQDELAEVQASIAQYQDCLKTMQEKKQELEDRILMEKFREVNALLEGQNMSMDDLKDLLTGEGEGGAQIA